MAERARRFSPEVDKLPAPPASSPSPNESVPPTGPDSGSHTGRALDQRSAVRAARLSRLDLAIILLAFLVRVWRLDAAGIWLDEATLLQRARSDLWTAAQGRTPLDLAPPLYPVLLHLWTQLGAADFWVRFPSAAAGALASALLLRVRVPAAPSTGRIAALLFAVAPAQLVYGQETTPYAFVGLLSAATWLAVSRLHTGQGWAAIGLIAVLSLYTYYGLAFILVPLDLALVGWLWHRSRRATAAPRSAGPAPLPPDPAPRPRAPRPLNAPDPSVLRSAADCFRPTWRAVILGHLALLAAIIPLAPLAIRQSAAGLTAWWGQYGVLEGWQAWTVFAQGALVHSLIFATFPFSRPPTALVAALLLLIGLSALRRPALFLVGWLAPVGLAYLAAASGRYPFEGRYLLVAAPAVYLLLAAGLQAIRPPLARWPLVAAAAALLLSAAPHAALPVPWTARPPREEVRSILMAVAQRHTAGDAVYVTYGAAPIVHHYQSLGLAPPEAHLEAGWPAGRVGYQATRALAAAAGANRLWIIVAHAPPGEEEALAWELTHRGARLVDRLAAPGAAALLFAPPP